ncbi:MAG: polysaccharide biosynthesis/export family protein, partial [Rectinemataceae bacterium]
MKRALALLMTLLIAIGSASAQQSLEGPETANQQALMAERLQLAISSTDYPVTPGDVYQLTYLRGLQQENVRIVVEADGIINAGLFGRIQAQGLSFRALKQMLEQKVAAAYPGSLPTLQIVATGLFSVVIRGEVQKAATAAAWGLSRLSEILKGTMLGTSSLRDVRIVRANGTSASYDLFRAEREGDLSQDPYL